MKSLKLEAAPIMRFINHCIILDMLGKLPADQGPGMIYPHKMEITITPKVMAKLQPSVQEMAVLDDVKFKYINNAFTIGSTYQLSSWIHDIEQGTVTSVDFNLETFDMTELVNCRLVVYSSQTVEAQLVYSDGTFYGADLGTAAELIEKFEEINKLI